MDGAGGDDNRDSICVILLVSNGDIIGPGATATPRQVIAGQIVGNSVTS